MFSMFDEFFKKIRLNRFQEPYNEKSFKKIKRLKSLQKAKMRLEPMQVFAMKLFHLKLIHLQ